MEITQEKLEDFVSQLKKITEFADTSMTILEDLYIEFGSLSLRVENILNIIAHLAKQESPEPALSSQALP